MGESTDGTYGTNRTNRRLSHISPMGYHKSHPLTALHAPDTEPAHSAPSWILDPGSYLLSVKSRLDNREIIIQVRRTAKLLNMI